MNRSHDSGSLHRLLAVTGALLIVSACAHVHQDDLDSELEQVRQEMREGDQAVENRLGERVDQVENRLETRMASLEADLGQLRDDFNVTVERLESAIRFNAPVHFAFDDDAVRPEDRPVLEQFAEVVRSYYGDAIITVEGFADPAGSPAYNLALGERRAESVKEYLAQNGIPADRMRAVSYGEAAERQIVPGARGPGEEGWQNRRVAMVIDFGPSPERRPVASLDDPEGDR